MPPIATLEQLQEIDRSIRQLKNAYPEASEEFVKLIGKFQSTGYKNIVRLLMEERTPQELAEREHAIATIDQLNAVNQRLSIMKQQYPAACNELDSLMRKYRMRGFKNIIRLFIGAKTPEQLAAQG